MKSAVLALVVVAGCATESDSPDIQRNYPPLSTIVPMTVPQIIPATTVPPNTVSDETPALPAPTETAATQPAITEPVPGPESELDPDVCPQDPDEIAAGEAPHPPPCD